MLIKIFLKPMRFNAMNHKKKEVLIVGAGPVGLFMANECAKYNLSYDIIDKKDGLSCHSKALAIHIRTLEMLIPSGLVDAVIQQGVPLKKVIAKTDGKILAQLAFSRMDAPFSHAVLLPQNKTEKILLDHLQTQGGFVDWQTEFINCNQDDKYISATVKTPNGEQRYKYTWLIACDGAHSTVRHACQLKFTGGRYDINWWLADVEMEWDSPKDTIYAYFNDSGICAVFPIKDNWFRLVTIMPDDYKKEINLECFIEQAKKHITDPFKIKRQRWLSEFRVSHRLIETYRQQRIFFAGDAAHIHSPIGGQGLNTGLQDIQNLAWKLALVQSGQASTKILDSYQQERMPVGKAVLQQTDSMTKAILLRNPIARWLRNILLPMLTSIKPLHHSIVARMSELTINYRHSDIVQQRGHTGKLYAGALMPNIIFNSKVDQKNLFYLLKNKSHHLLIFCYSSDNIAIAIKLYKTIQKKYETLITCHLVSATHESTPYSTFIDQDWQAHINLKLTSPCLALVRPDQYLGYCQRGLEIGPVQEYLEQILQIYGHRPQTLVI